MSKLYGLGASIVILGALFKIQHFPGAAIMLVGGMSIEAIIFFFSAFEPLHEEYDWSLVYPELAGMEGPKSGHALQRNAGVPMRASNDPLSQKLDELLSNANIG
ncbi:MAG: gliding motility protein GldL, partial [Bacteroidales bacterium]